MTQETITWRHHSISPLSDSVYMEWQGNANIQWATSQRNDYLMSKKYSERSGSIKRNQSISRSTNGWTPGTKSVDNVLYNWLDRGELQVTEGIQGDATGPSMFVAGAVFRGSTEYKSSTLECNCKFGRWEPWDTILLMLKNEELTRLFRKQGTQLMNWEVQDESNDWSFEYLATRRPLCSSSSSLKNIDELQPRNG